ncbi:MAG TPA: amino acid adenylation domain-containing protein, partial [Ktedonobacteraceae bacterium]
GDPSFEELLGRVREVCVQAYAHQDWPFEQVVEDLHPHRDLSRNPLVQILFSFQTAPSSVAQFPGIESSRLPFAREISKFDLSLSVTETAQGLQGNAEYSTDLFEPASIQRLIEHYQRLLEAVVAAPGMRLSTRQFLSPAEVQQLLLIGEHPPTSYPHAACVHTLFEQQVERNPDTIAVVGGDEHLSYLALERQANALAAFLRHLGVGPEVLVGLCVERCLELPIGLLGILKAGGAYLPLDPDHPQERLASILQEARISVILTQSRLRTLLPQTSADVICLDTHWQQQEVATDQRVPAGVIPENAVYTIYTSGSTGRPKGVVNIHRGIVNRICWMQHTYHLKPGERVLQKTPCSFDVSVWEFFWTLGTGATLVLARAHGHRDSAYLVQTIAEQNITTIHFVPAMLKAFVEERDVEALQSLKRVFSSGEALSTRLQERFVSRLGAQLHNLYGPTEASIDVTFWACNSSVSSECVPIGRPIANTSIALLDAHLQLVPEGVPAGLFIGGIGVARGYLYQPALTAERFLPDPFSQIPGARIYRSGDVARYLPAGVLEFVGRDDRQLKIRGNRVEPGEIEAVLARRLEIRDVIVQVQEDPSGEQCLACYLRAHTDQQLTTAQLRTYLLAWLPEYMLPSRYTWLEVFPLTASGKIDQQALSALSTAPAPRLDQVLPRTSLEHQLAGIWQDVLDVESVGIHDNFFELGGHSLLIIRVHKKVQALTRKDIALTDLFRYPTISAFAEYIEQQQHTDRSTSHGQQRGRARRNLREQQWRTTLRQGTAYSEE